MTGFNTSAGKEMKKMFENRQATAPWIFLAGWPRTDETSKLRLTVGSLGDQRFSEPKHELYFTSKNFTSTAKENNYFLTYTNFSQGGMSGGPLLDAAGRVVGIHSAAEGERMGLREIQLGGGIGVHIDVFLRLAQHVGIDSDSLKIERFRPRYITKEEEDSITKELLTVKPPDGNLRETDWFNYGNDLWRVMSYKEALTAFDEAIKRKPDFYQAYYAKGMVIEMQERKSWAEKNPPSQTLFEPSIPQDSATIKLSKKPSLAEINQQLEEFNKKQEADIQKMNQINQESSASIRKTNHLWLVGLPYFKKASEINPNFEPAWRKQGFIEYFSGMSLKLGNNITPSSGRSLENSNKIPAEARDAYGRALSAYNKAIALNPIDAHLYKSKADTLIELERYKEAINTYSKAIEIEPSTEFYIGRIQAYESVGNMKQAEADVARAKKLDPSFTWSISIGKKKRLGLDYFTRGRSSTALSKFDKSLSAVNKELKILEGKLNKWKDGH